jgi:hypothetical protein
MDDLEHIPIEIAARLRRQFAGADVSDRTDNPRDSICAASGSL